MLHFNGKTFARNDDEFLSSLFTPGGTCTGYYKPIKSGFQLFDMQKNLRAFISTKERIVVSAHRTAEGRARYMFATSSIEEQWLDLPQGMQAQHDAVVNLSIV